MYYYERLKQIRERHGYNASSIATILQMQLPMYSLVELGRKELTATQLAKLCRFYKVSADEILGIDLENIDIDNSVVNNEPERDDVGDAIEPKAKKISGLGVFAKSLREGFAEAAVEEAERKERNKELMNDAKRKNNYY